MKRRSFKISISRQYTIGKKINSHLIENDGKPSNISACVLLVFYCNFLICNSFFFKYIFKTALSGDFIPITKDFSLLTICELIDTSVAVPIKIIRPYMHVVVQKTDGAIHRINHYPVDEY